MGLCFHDDGLVHPLAHGIPNGYSDLSVSNSEGLLKYKFYSQPMGSAPRHSVRRTLLSNPLSAAATPAGAWCSHPDEYMGTQLVYNKQDAT